MKVSIITVCFNSEATIADTLRSVASQDYPDIQHIVIDGASTDRTCEIIRENKQRVSLFVSEKDKGIYDAINKGLKLAAGEVVGILNSDDFYTDNKVISEVAALFEKNNCEGVYADLDYVDRNNTGRVVRRWRSGKYRDGMFLRGWMPPHPAFFVRREVYRKYGTFNASMRLAADYELMLRFIHKHKISLCYLQRPVVKMRAGGAGNRSLAARLLNNREDRMAWEINGLKPAPWTLLLKPISKIFQFLG